jgi:hypothetical protein
MPWGDRTGPAGMGPLTGRGLGYCAGFLPFGSRRAGRARFFGRGRRFGFFGAAALGLMLYTAAACAGRKNIRFKRSADR